MTAAGCGRGRITKRQLRAEAASFGLALLGVHCGGASGGARGGVTQHPSR
jgi:hypothetical protein